MMLAGAPIPRVKSDPIATEIIREKLQSIPDLVEADLTRTAFSPLVYEYKDYSVGLVDAEGRIIALARRGLPMFTASMIGCAVRDGLEIFGSSEIEPGDIIITNHAGTLGQHLNNVVMYTPAFDADQRLVGFMAIIVHWIDIGGRYPGSCAGTDTTELLQEGLQLRSIKIHRRGEPVEDVYRIIEYNTRLPQMLLGDVAAQVAGCLKGRHLLEELLRRHGSSVLLGAIDSIWESSENAARAAVRSIPDGVYEMESHLDDDGVDLGRHIPVKIKVRIEDGNFTVDFSEVGAQVRGPYNSGVYGGAETAARVAFKYLFTPDEPPNEGGFAPVKIVIPPGKFLSAGPNAPMGKYSSTLATVTDTIIAAMAAVMPERVAAGHHASFGVMNISGIEPRTGQYFNYLDTAHGGWGGSSRGDGVGPYKTVMHADNKDIPVEVQEALYPIRVELHQWRCDSAGAGRSRGGSGVEKTFLALAPFVTNFSFERSSCAPWGLFGGKPGASGEVELKPAQGQRRIIYKESNVRFEAGDRFHVRSGGGGGFGPPAERSRDRIRDDVEQGYVSSLRAREDYGVVLSQIEALDRTSNGKSGASRLRSTARAVIAPLLALIVSCLGAHADSYPLQPIHLIVPFAAGGGVDVTARIVAQKMAENLGQPVLVENRTGGGGIVGADVVAKSSGDGYTFMITTSGHTILPSLAKLPWDPIKDFVPVTKVVSYPLMMVVNPSVPAKSISELIALAKAKPGTLNYGTGGLGTPPHLAMELFKSMVGIDVVHVPYRGNGPATAALLTGEIQMIMDTMIGPLPSVRAGTLRALAVTSRQRSPLLPELPTLDEAGVPGYVFEGWTGMFAPAGTPADIVIKINSEIGKALAVPEINKRLIELGYQTVGDPPDKFAAAVAEDLATVAKIVSSAGIKTN